LDENKPFATSTSSAIGIIRSILAKYLDNPNLKYIGRGRDRDPDDARMKVHSRRDAALKMGRKGKPMYITGYIAVKISLSELPLEDVYGLAEEELRANFIVLHDVDIACDCAGITTRALVEDYLVANGVSIQKVVLDKSMVGNDCISWRDHKERRCKVYNKF
ncbi:hypothetical protein BGZ83_002947, partial [Gryganskiella cystojenkinii]